MENSHLVVNGKKMKDWDLHEFQSLVELCDWEQDVYTAISEEEDFDSDMSYFGMRYYCKFYVVKNKLLEKALIEDPSADNVYYNDRLIKAHTRFQFDPGSVRALYRNYSGVISVFNIDGKDELLASTTCSRTVKLNKASIRKIRKALEAQIETLKKFE